MSATPSVFNFRYEHGRRYHAYAEGQYPVPNDEVRSRNGCAAGPVGQATNHGTYHRPRWTGWIYNITLSD